MANKCENCRWWRDINEDNEGWCHRYPPIRTHSDDEKVWYLHIPTKGDDYCGEHQQKEERDE